MAVEKTRLGATGSSVDDLGSMGALSPILKQLGGGEKAGRMAMDYASQMYPDAPEADPWEAALRFFLSMGQSASQPGATLLSSGLDAAQAPLDYLSAKKREKTETDRARMQTALQLAPSLKAKPAAAGSYDWVVDKDGNTVRLSNSEIIKRQAAGETFKPWSKDTSTTANDLKPFGIIDPTKLAEIQRVVPSASVDAFGNVLLTDAEAAKAGVRPYIGQKVTPAKDGAAPRPESKADLQGVLRYTANPPAGKNIGDEVWDGVVTTGFTENQLKLADSLRDDLTRTLTDFNDITSSMKDINSFYTLATTTANPISDYSLAVQYAKIIDPGTAAREGEVAAIASAGSLTGAARAQIMNAILGQGKLSPRMRASIFNNSLKIYESKLTGALGKIERYKTQSEAQAEGLFDLVGLNVDLASYKRVGGDPEVDTDNYHLLDLSTIEEDPTDSNPDALVFPEDFSFDGFTRGALISMLGLPPGALDAATLDKLEAALADL